MDNITAILDRISKLLALANDKGATEHEAQQAATMVQKLLDKYQLSMEQVKPIKQHTSNDVVFDKLQRDKPRMFDWEIRLLNAISYATGTTYVFSNVSITFVGLPNDTKIAREMYVQFRAVAQTLAKRATQDYSANYDDPRSLTGIHSLRTFRLSYLVGFSSGLYQAFRQAKQANDQAQQIQALVLVKEGLIKTAVAEKYGKLRSWSSTQTTYHRDAMNMGTKDGYSAANRKSLDDKG